jgi:transketolase
VFVIVGDSELHEGSNWEAMMLASHLNLNNLCLLVDYNTLGGIDCINDCCSLEPLRQKLSSFGFNVFEINGHDLDAIMTTIKDSQNSATPTAIICHTVKGKGVSFMEGNNAWHYRPPSKDEYEKALAEITGSV